VQRRNWELAMEMGTPPAGPEVAGMQCGVDRVGWAWPCVDIFPFSANSTCEGGRVFVFFLKNRYGTMS
jgi:hypothetical protein